MKVLVTGATGFIGGNVARALVTRGHQVKALVRPDSSSLNIDDTGIETALGDVRDRASVARALEGCQGVVHCAALYTFWSRDPRLTYEVNVAGTRTVLDEALRAGVGRCVHTSTVSTIGIPHGGLGTEADHPLERDLVGHYKRSKHQAEVEAMRLAQQGLPVVVVNPTYPVGPWDVKPTPTGRVVLDYMMGRIPAYINTGMNLVDVEDVAEGHALALEKGVPGERYLLGNQNMTLGAMFGLLEGITGRRAPKLRLPLWMALGAGYVDELVEGRMLGRKPRIPLEGVKVSRKPMYVSCEKAVRELGLAQSPVQGALEKAVKWFRDYGYAGSRNGRRASER